MLLSMAGRHEKGARHGGLTDDRDRRPCPWCGGARVVKNGSFRLTSGERVQRYLCRFCRRTFSPLTGKPAYRLRKLAEWNAMVRLLPASLPLRKVASRLKISVSTAFHWRHRALAVLNQKVHQPLSGDVSVCMFRVKYSEKGSRVCNGPGSWGYWNILRRGPEPFDRYTPRAAGGGKRRFRLLIDGRPLAVMAAQTGEGYELCIVGQGKPVPEFVAKGLAQLVEPGSHVYAFELPESEKACEFVGLVHHDGFEAVHEWYQRREAEPTATTRLSGHTSARCPIRSPDRPTGWLWRFRGVATRYLAHYLAWFRDIVRVDQFPDLVAQACSVLLASRECRLARPAPGSTALDGA